MPQINTNRVSANVNHSTEGIIPEEREPIDKKFDDDIANEGGSSSFNKQSAALLISGASLSLAFEDPELNSKVMELFKLCSSIIVYRSSPDEKARTVRKVMETDPDAFTLAIGDGANDVNMI